MKTLIIGTLILLLSMSCKSIKPYQVSYDLCPIDKSERHYRKHGKHINPEECNEVGVIGILFATKTNKK